MDITVVTYLSSIGVTFIAGIGIGYKIGHPNISSHELDCRIYNNSDSDDIVRGKSIIQTLKNGKPVSVACPFYHEGTKDCSETGTLCPFGSGL